MKTDLIVAAFAEEPFGQRFAEAARYLDSHPEKPASRAMVIDQMAVPMMLFLFQAGLHLDVPVDIFVDELVVYLHGLIENGEVLPDGRVMIDVQGLSLTLTGNEPIDEAVIMTGLAKLFSEGLNRLYADL